MTEPNRDKLWATDDELIYLLGVPERIARPAIQELDKLHRQTGFPQKQKLWGDRRYVPAVRAYFDQHYGAKLDAPQSQERRRYG
jgi:hypothetical protein